MRGGAESIWELLVRYDFSRIGDQGGNGPGWHEDFVEQFRDLVGVLL